MILYNVTTNINLSVQHEWLEWMKNVHIPEVMQTGMFLEFRFLKVLGDEDSGGATYSIQYTCESMQKFKEYETNFAPALRKQMIEKYKDKFVAFRTLLEVVK